ncbi:MAG: UDP-N-acetylglucosamine--N-acetylmuramyl-(pentapeptide) pyrophosphoryl-undecaprenol N-acetylglucosamine transferase [Deltaproteobacteria bacterium]|jgi:UDP-N-acetylglucosamine--N-acetylmuramyl-(pentapeptide) pyrophosphoryl-undecaprenol N-acetylglucosamine transferase|nr:MAG: UDP-N-acetylglucosamine--N-acetylmuramyl-(pentapeptide) pyrophosphoryl-undecaprenol N-acetylglucosamine transferase [Deltaproteobacteria bacterium]
MRIVIAGGGSGGHVFPAISIGEEILRRDPGNRVLFVGTKRGIESKVFKNGSYPIEFISSSGVVGKGFKESIRGVVLAFRGFFESLGLLRRFKPDLVVGVGGYVSGPVVAAAFLLRIPTAICEQNAIPGITNRILSVLAKRIFVSFERNLAFFPNRKTVVTGNPIRSSLLTIQKDYASPKDVFVILVFGGSQGAKTLNQSVPKAVGLLGRRNVYLIHQTGERGVEDVRKTYEWFGIRAEVVSFIEDMNDAYRRADLVIGRAGAGTIAEITAIGIASILIPYPFSVHNHQLENARTLEKEGAAVVIEDKDAVPEKIAEVLDKILHWDKLREMGLKAKRLGRPDAAGLIVNEIYTILGVYQDVRKN